MLVEVALQAEGDGRTTAAGHGGHVEVLASGAAGPALEL